MRRKMMQISLEGVAGGQRTSSPVRTELDGEAEVIRSSRRDGQGRPMPRAHGMTSSRHPHTVQYGKSAHAPDAGTADISPMELRGCTPNSESFKRDVLLF